MLSMLTQNMGIVKGKSAADLECTSHTATKDATESRMWSSDITCKYS